MIKKIATFIAIISALTFMGTPAYAASGSSGGTKCGTTQTQLIGCETETGVGTINSLISITVNVLTVVIGIVATGGLAYAAIVYASARDDQSKVNEAKDLIRNIVIGLVLYGLTIAILAWLLPGSVISGGGESDTSGQTTSPSPSASSDQGTVTPQSQ